MTDWPTKTLGDVCEFQNGYAFRSSEYVRNGHALIRIKNVQQGEIVLSDDVFVQIPKDGSLNQFVLNAGDILMSLTGYLGRVGRLDETDLPAALNQRVAKVSVKSKGSLFDGFLYRVLDSQWFRDQVEVYGRGAAQQNVGTSDISKIEIPVPPLEEQKRIVELLDAATARVTELTACYEQARAHANDLLESSLLELFADAFESQPKRKMGEVLQIARGGSPRPISEYITKSPNGVNWIKIGDASSSTKYIYETAQKIKPEGVSRSRMVYPGDFLLSNSMSFGRPYIMKTEGCIHDGWLVLRDSKGELDQDFLFYMLGSRFMYERFSQLAAGSTVQNLNSALVSSIEIPVPPIDFQKRIAEKARLLEENVARLNQLNEIRLQQANDLRQSILEAAFAGDL